MVFILNLKLYNMRLMQVIPSEGEGGGVMKTFLVKYCAIMQSNMCFHLLSYVEKLAFCDIEFGSIYLKQRRAVLLQRLTTLA